ncbi:MAG TPA: FAD/NAD(P)-binding oxidoreductase [Trebonia sp.]|nr:FAD/NAD(P)-binding oxidoreductase [Trebonia sp.]
MSKTIVVLGGGTGGTLIANRLRRMLGRSAVSIVVIDADDEHVYQPGLLFVPFGKAEPASLTRPRHRQFRSGITFRQAAVDRVDLDANEVQLAGGERVGYDVLVIATGARLVPEETEGLTGPGWMEKVFTFYTLAGAVALRRALAGFQGGRLAVAVMDMPVKCPVAPLEFCFLADAYFRERGIRDKVELTYVTPLDGAFTKPVCDRELSGLLKDKGVSLVTEFNTGEVAGADGKLVSFDGREVPFDLAVVVPLHGGQAYVERSPGLGDELGFVPADQRTLQSKARPNVFVIGDAADIPTSKAGSVAHFEGDVVARNIARYLAGEPLDADFDGHTNCFIESGSGKALLIDFNYGTEPLTGRFPGRIGLPLLRQSRLNHLGKLAFGWLYWHVLLPGREIPAVRSRMPAAGKHFPPSAPR